MMKTIMNMIMNMENTMKNDEDMNMIKDRYELKSRRYSTVNQIHNIN